MNKVPLVISACMYITWNFLYHEDSHICRNYVKSHTTVKGYAQCTARTQDTGIQCDTREGNTGVIKKRSKRVESFSSF
jgi:hypothetical protein